MAAGINGMTDRDDELAALIAEQAEDARRGDRVYGLSLDAPTGAGGSTLGDMVLGGGRLAPRHELKVKPIPGLLGARARELQRRRKYGAICGDCGIVTDGSNGRAKAPKLCVTCANKKREAKHGTPSKYALGCRCVECRWAASDAHREPQGKPPPTHGVSGYINYRCRCEVCRAAGSENNRRQRERRLARSGLQSPPNSA